jgi:YggT family protein
LPEESALAIVVRSQDLALTAGLPIAEALQESNLDNTASLLAYWYFHLPNFILAALMYTMLGRFLLGLMVDADSPNYIWRFFCRITDPFIALIAPLTPKAAAPVVIWLFGVVWLFWLRVGFLYTSAWLGYCRLQGAVMERTLLRRHRLLRDDQRALTR